METLKQIGISLLVTLAVILLAASAVLGLDLKGDITHKVTTTNPVRSTSVKVLSKEESRSLNIFKAPNSETLQGILVGSFWRCSEDETRCDIVLVACTEDQSQCAEY